MVSISPIGSTADSPLRKYIHHGDCMSPNYGTPAKGYEGMGSFHTLPGGRVLHNEGLVKDVADFTRKMYQRGASGLALPGDADTSSGNYVALNRSAYKLHTEIMPYSHNK